MKCQWGMRTHRFLYFTHFAKEQRSGTLGSLEGPWRGSAGGSSLTIISDMSTVSPPETGSWSSAAPSSSIRRRFAESISSDSSKDLSKTKNDLFLLRAAIEAKSMRETKTHKIDPWMHLVKKKLHACMQMWHIFRPKSIMHAHALSFKSTAGNPTEPLGLPRTMPQWLQHMSEPVGTASRLLPAFWTRAGMWSTGRMKLRQLLIHEVMTTCIVQKRWFLDICAPTFWLTSCLSFWLRMYVAAFPCCH